MAPKKYLLCLMAIITINIVNVIAYPNVTLQSLNSETAEPEILSRKRRFLIFPDGSSFQMVFCTQTPGFLQVDKFIWFGTTTAIAWELPTDPRVFNFLKDKTATSKMDVQKHIKYFDENGKIVADIPYLRRTIANPVFAKRSTNIGADEPKATMAQMHKESKKRDYLKIRTNAEYHIEGRISLYKKLVKVIESFGGKGEYCIQKFICDANTKKDYKQLGFLSEILHTVFTIPETNKSHPYVIDKKKCGKAKKLCN